MKNKISQNCLPFYETFSPKTTRHTYLCIVMRNEFVFFVNTLNRFTEELAACSNKMLLL